MKKNYLILLLLLTTVRLSAQTFSWAKREGLYAYDYGYGVTTDAQGNVYMAGKYEELANFSGTILPCQGNHDIYLAKYTPTGDLTWIRTGGGGSGDYALCVATDKNAFVYIAGEIEGTNEQIIFPGSPITLTCVASNDIVLAKYSLDGDLVWAKRAGGFDNEKTHGITLDSDSNVYICGYIHGYATFDNITVNGHGNTDAYVAKYNKNGDCQWVRTMGGPDRDDAQGIVSDGNGNVYVTGMFSNAAVFGSQTIYTPDSFMDQYLVKFDTNGNMQWVRKGTGSYDQVGWGVTMDNGGKIYATGEFNSSMQLGSTQLNTVGAADVYVTCYNDQGDLQWAKRAGGNQVDRARGIGTDGFNIYITGQFGGTANFGPFSRTASDGSDVFMAALDNAGNFQWATSVGGAADGAEDLGYESGICITADDHGIVYAGGAILDGSVFGATSYGAYSRTDAFITRIDQGADNTPPLAVSFTPADNAVDVAPDATLLLSFSEPVEAGAGDFKILEHGLVTQTIPVLSASVTINGNEVTITPPNNFSDSALVEIQFASGVIKDLAGNAFVGINDTSTWNLTVRTPIVPAGLHTVQANTFSIFPNPSNGIVTIHCSDQQSNRQLRVLNALGQTILEKELHGTITNQLDLSSAGKGIYLFELQSDTGIERHRVVLR